MRRQYGVRTHPSRQGSIGAHRTRVLLLTDAHALVIQRRRRSLLADAASDRADAPRLVSAPNPPSMWEREVHRMPAHGLRDKEIAHLLVITDRTVTFRAQAIYRKRDIANRTKAVMVARRRGIVALDPHVPEASDAV